MATLILQDIRTEGNSVYLTSYPITGVLGLVSFMEDVTGEDNDHYVEKLFRYTTDGIHYSEWMSLSFSNLTSLPLQPHQIVRFELQYLKHQPLGSNQIEVNSAEIGYDQQSSTSIQDFFNKTIFKKFFESNDPQVLNWYINVLNKLYQKGLIPDYFERNVGEAIDVDRDFLQFWSSIAKFFAYYVVYARQFQNFHQSESLLFEFLEQRGLKVSDSTTLEQMNLLMQDYYAEVFKRGTLKVVEKFEEGAANDGELLRLLWYKRFQDEFIYNPRLPQHIGWNLGNSSPLYKGLYLHDNANKAPEKQLYPQDLTHYFGGELVDQDVSNTYLTHLIKPTIKIENSLLKFQKLIKVDSNLDYELSFIGKIDGALSVFVTLYDKDMNTVDSYSHLDGSISQAFLNQAHLYRNDRFLPVKLFLYNWQKPKFTYDTTEIHQGNDLRMSKDAVWLSVEIAISGVGYLYGIRILPLKTPYSHGLIQTNNVIDSFVINNNHYYTFNQVVNHIKKYFIPYSSHLFPINIREFFNESVEEGPVLRNIWIGGDGYCQKAAWRGINPICETMEVRWIPEEETAYCEEDVDVAGREANMITQGALYIF